MLAALAVAWPAAGALAQNSVQYPPRVYYDFGSLSSGGESGTSQCSSFLVASRLLGTGGPYATLWLSGYISYEAEDQNGNFKTASLGNSAAMEFSSPTAGFVTFDFLSQNVPQGDTSLQQPFPFTVTSTTLKDGIFTMQFTVALPACTLRVVGKYRSLL
jgi:hypothetical protein